MNHLPLWTVGWGFSTRCDLHCPFCYSSRVRECTPQSEAPLADAEVFLAANGAHIRALNFGTGECFLAPGFPRLLELCRQYAPHARVAVTTNGALADLPAETQAIVAQTLHECDVSLDFAQADAHDRWRGKAGTWRRAIHAIELAQTLGLQTSIVTVGTAQTLTAANLRGLMRLASEHQVAFRVNLYMPTFGDTTFLPSGEAVFRLLMALREWGAAVRSSDRLLSHVLGHTAADSHLDARYSCRLLPDGSVSPSTYLLHAPWVAPAALTALNLSVLPDTPSFTHYADPPIPAACAGCPSIVRCQGGSVERRWLWIHDLNAPDPLCPRLYPLPDGEYAQLAAAPLATWAGPTVHLDYLPTIVALPPTVPDAAAV